MTPRVVTVSLMSLVAGVLLPALSDAQPLGRIAAEEAARRKTITQPARVITGSDLRDAPPGLEPLPADQAQADEPAGKRVLVNPARLSGGAVPIIPIQAVAAGEVVLEVSVDRRGKVTGVKPLRHTAPFTESMTAAIRTWTFTPAEDAPAMPAGETPKATDRKAMDSTVLVVGLFRPPALFAPTLGEPPKTVAKGSGTAPVPMVALEMPAYPPNAMNDGVVLLELDVATHGGITGIDVVRSSPAFDKPAIAAASSLIFAPGRVHDRPAPAYVYVVAGFRQPVTF